MSTPIKVGIIGLSAKGSWAALPYSHLGALRSAPLSSSYKVTAVSNSTLESSVAAAEAYGEEGKPLAAHGGPTESIASDPNVDLVLVSLKGPKHKAVALTAIAAGKSVYIEWPVGNGLEETKELAQAANAKGVRSIIGTQGWQIPAVKKVRCSILRANHIRDTLFNSPLSSQAKEWIAQGKIGKVISATYVRLALIYPSSTCIALT